MYSTANVLGTSHIQIFFINNTVQSGRHVTSPKFILKQTYNQSCPATADMTLILASCQTSVWNLCCFKVRSYQILTMFRFILFAAFLYEVIWLMQTTQCITFDSIFIFLTVYMGMHECSHAGWVTLTKSEWSSHYLTSQCWLEKSGQMCTHKKWLHEFHSSCRQITLH